MLSIKKTLVTGGIFFNVLTQFSNIFSFICTNKEFINISNVILLDSYKTHLCITPEDQRISLTASINSNIILFLFSIRYHR